MKTNQTYDVVIVGGGVIGALMAKQVTAAGKRVLMLEAGANAKLDVASYQELLATYLANPGGATNAAIPPNVNAPSANVLDIGKPSFQSYLVQMGPLPFLSDYIRALGGTTLHWQASCPRMVPNDFRMHSVYGQGEDWPLSYDDIEPYYRQAEAEFGVAADVEDQKFLGMHFPPDYVYPMHRVPPSYLNQFFMKRLGEDFTLPLYGGEYPVRPVSVPQARNSTPNARFNGGKGYQPVSAVDYHDQGQRCQGNSSCTPFCPSQGKYTGLKTLAAIPTDRFDLHTQCVASRLLIDSASGRIDGVEYLRYADPNTPGGATKQIAKGTIYVLAANAIENARLLLSSGAANSSDQLGRNLMDHPYIHAWGLAPEPVYPFRGPDAVVGIETLRDGKFREKHASMRGSLNNWGWGATGSPGADLAMFVGEGYFGRQLRQQLEDRVLRQVRMGVMVEQLPHPSNRVRIDPAAYVDPLGLPRPVIEYNIDGYSLAGASKARWVAGQVFEKAGVTDYTDYMNRIGFLMLGHEGENLNIQGSGHVVGTHRMGKSRLTSVVDTTMRTWDHPNLYLAGCGNMVTIGTSNPTLTAAALTFIAAENLLKELR